MKIKGRILFYNSQLGEGKIILDTKEKIYFSVDAWDDFDVGPETNLIVECEVQDNVIKSIKVPLESAPKKQESSKEERSVTLSSEEEAKDKVAKTLKSYFSHIEGVIGDPPEIINTKDQLDFFLSKRFLLTSYNNLRSLDPSLYEHKSIKEKLDTIEDLQKAYYSVTEKMDIPHLAFEMIFLRIQPEYIKYQKKRNVS